MRLLITALALCFLVSCTKDSDSDSIVDSTAITSSTTIMITKSWSEAPSGYRYPIDVRVPTSEMPQDGYPVCILLHGNGGNGTQIMDDFSNTLACHVLVAPTGYMNSWNLCSENSNAPDIEMVQDLIDSIQTYTNINSNKIRILGFSNGAGLANSVFIENTDAGVDIVCAIVSHLNEPQYHSENFYKIGSNTDSSMPFCGYDAIADPIKTRKYLSISNDNDPIIPYLGGYSMVGLDFLNAEDAAFYIAQNQGHTGNMSSAIAIGDPVVYAYEYLSVNVVHVKGSAAHSINATQKEYISSFFSGCLE